MTFVLGYDCTGAEVSTLPAGANVAGYTTGSDGVPWTEAQFAAFPNPVRICQDAGATDTTADVLDVESGAATIADVPGWFVAALANYKSGTRPGQRFPTVYSSLSNITNIANALVSAKLDVAGDAPALWVAHWGLTLATAEGDVTDTGPFPIIGYQYNNGPNADVDVWEASWWNTVSTSAPEFDHYQLLAWYKDSAGNYSSQPVSTSDGGNF